MPGAHGDEDSFARFIGGIHPVAVSSFSSCGRARQFGGTIVTPELTVATAAPGRAVLGGNLGVQLSENLDLNVSGNALFSATSIEAGGNISHMGTF
jgi:hypothetical protein